MNFAFLKLAPAERGQYFVEVSARRNLSPVLLEKNFWVCWLLGLLFRSEFAEHLVIQGGTSLSEVFKVIGRFSEDSHTTSRVISKQVTSNSLSVQREFEPAADISGPYRSLPGDDTQQAISDHRKLIGVDPLQITGRRCPFVNSVTNRVKVEKLRQC